MIIRRTKKKGGRGQWSIVMSISLLSVKIILRKASPKGKAHKNQKRNVVIFYIYHTQKVHMQKIEQHSDKIKHAYFHLYILWSLKVAWGPFYFKKRNKKHWTIVQEPFSGLKKFSETCFVIYRWKVQGYSHVMLRFLIQIVFLIGKLCFYMSFDLT